MNDPILPEPPAIVRADTAEMDQLAFEITSALEAGAKAARTTLERYRDAGDALTKARDKASKGGWLKWLASHRINRTDAWRAIQIAKHWDHVSRETSVRAAMNMLAVDVEEQEIGQEITATGPVLPESPTAPEPPKCRECRMLLVRKPNCSKCKELLSEPASDAATSNNSSAHPPRTRCGPPREPGDETEPTGEIGSNQFLARIASLSKSLPKDLERLPKLHQVTIEQARWAWSMIKKGLEEWEKLAKAPQRPGEPPRPAKCKYCQADILWATTAKGKNLALNVPPGGGSWDIVENWAVQSKHEISAEGRDLYRAHFMSCPNNPRKK